MPARRRPHKGRDDEGLVEGRVRRAAYHVSVLGAKYLGGLIEDALAGLTVETTINRFARPGDRVLFYVPLPVSALVGRAVVVTPPAPYEDAQSEWDGYLMSEMEEVAVFEEYVPRSELLSRYPLWRYFYTPVFSVSVKEECRAYAEECFARKVLTAQSR